MLKSLIQALDERLLFPYRYAKLTAGIAPLLNDVTTVLDVGPGDGRLSRYLMDMTDCQICGIDVFMQPQQYIEIQQYDGHVFPFDDDSFDCVMMVDMLHHTTNIEQMIAEASRVARQSIIIKDHYWENRFDLTALRVADYLGNIPYNVPLPYNFLSLTEWEALFHTNGLTEINRSSMKFARVEPAKHIVVKLQVAAPTAEAPLELAEPQAAERVYQPG